MVEELFLPRDVPFCKIINTAEDHDSADEGDKIGAGFHATGLFPGGLDGKTGTSHGEINQEKPDDITVSENLTDHTNRGDCHCLETEIIPGIRRAKIHM
jgi:hypothetical protein